ncbi:hypothetical protein PENTCL1PPCAC_7134, partial [Pristionchus entomophagus]
DTAMVEAATGMEEEEEEELLPLHVLLVGTQVEMRVGHRLEDEADSEVLPAAELEEVVIQEVIVDAAVEEEEEEVIVEAEPMEHPMEPMGDKVAETMEDTVEAETMEDTV